MELEGWDKLVQVNLNGVLYCMRAVLPTMRKQQDGSIINVRPGPAATSRRCRARPTPRPSMRCWR